jgi:hypothetical protein
MKSVLVAIFFGVCTCIQVMSQVLPAESACGPTTAHFDTQTLASRVVPQPVEGKSQIYVIEVFDKVVGEIARPTLRVGIDGNWMGADKGNSYVAFSVEPGEHHLCTNWQSHLKRLYKEAAFLGFTAEAGKIYFFRARITEHGGSTGASTFSLDLDQLNDDEGKYLVASSSSSVSRLKK